MVRILASPTHKMVRFVAEYQYNTSSVLLLLMKHIQYFHAGVTHRSHFVSHILFSMSNLGPQFSDLSRWPRQLAPYSR